MQRILIQAVNFFLLMVLFVGVPAVAHAQFGDWQITPATTIHHLIFAGLLIAAAGNVLSAWLLIKSKKERILCWEWAVVFGGLLAVQFAFIQGYLNFDWLKQALQWLQKHL